MIVSVWEVYVVDREGKEVHLCRCVTVQALGDIIATLANLGTHGPHTMRMIRLEVDRGDNDDVQ